MKQINFIPNTITAFGLACGLFVILKVNMIEPGSSAYDIAYKSALLLLLVALADFVDGAVARVFKADSDFGIIFDSMADAISFGVAPSVVLLKTLTLEHGSFLSFVAASGVMVFSLCGILRLVKYTIGAFKEKTKVDKDQMDLEKKHFTGLPIPAAAAFAISTNLFLLSPFLSNYVVISDMFRTIFLTSVNLILGYLMLSRWKFLSLKGIHFKMPSFHLAFLTGIAALFFLYGIFYYFSLVFAICAWGYILIAFTIAVIRLIAGKKSKTLKEFDPEEEADDIENIEEK